MYFIDLPGYGYAKVAEQVKAGWTSLIESFFHDRRQIALGVQIVDARLGPTELDTTMMGWLDFYDVPFVLVLTKADKIPFNKLQTQIKSVQDRLAKYTHLSAVLQFSAVTGDGRYDLLKTIESFVNAKEISPPKHYIPSAVA
jgi:GTP-binding protein